MKILKWDKNCASCYFAAEQGGECYDHSKGPCSKRMPDLITNLEYWHYASAEQVLGMVAEAEAGYRWSRKLVKCICAQSEYCDFDCALKKPFGWLSVSMHCGRQSRVVKLIPYRGERPEKENDMGPTSNARALNVMGYRVVKDFDLEILALDGAVPDAVFRGIYISGISISKRENDIILWDTKDYDLLQEHKDKLIDAGYIEPVNDPVLYERDTFRYKFNGELYMVVPSGSGRCVLSSLEKNHIYKLDEIFSPGVTRLSDFVPEDVNQFIPVKIEVKEVE